METNCFQIEESHHDNNTHGHGGLELRLRVVDKSNDLEDDDDSDDSTPRLWKPSSPEYHQNNTSPSSRNQAIAKGRKELMDMVKDLPESFYELSLKDLVEQKAELELQKGIIVIPEENKTLQQSVNKEEEETKKECKSVKKVKKSTDSKKKMVTSTSIDNGRFLLRTSVFPISLGSKKNKNNLGATTSFKLAPMRTTEPGSRDWWRRKSCILSETGESNAFSSSNSLSSSTNTRQSKVFLPICCLCSGRKITSKT